MYSKRYTRFLFFNCLFLLIFLRLTTGQTLPNFPYSALGVGEYDYNAQGMLSGMGYGVSAMQSNNFINNSNPASYSTLQDKLVLGELSTTGRSVNLQTSQSNAKSSDFDVSRFAIGIKVSKFWGTSVGLLPVSTVSYQIVSPKTIIGSSQSINTIYEGNGGLHEFYWGNGFRIGKHLSLGAQLNYIFGSINQTEKVGYDVSTPILSSTQQTYLSNINFSYGLQYYTKISKMLDMSVGLLYQSKRALRANYTLSIISGGDTLTNQTLQDNYFTIPAQYRGGIAFTYANKLTFDFDYIFEKWSDLAIKNDNVSLVNSSSYGLGIQWLPWKKEFTYEDNLIQRMLFEGGLNYTQSYLQISQHEVNDMNFTIGAGLYNRPRNISLSMGFAFGTKSAGNSGLINENYTNFYCSLIVRNIWFVRKKYY